MTVSSRTPDGLPYRCPVCGKTSAQWPCIPEGAAICPHCGCMIWLSWLQEYFHRTTGIPADSVTLRTTFAELGADSLDLVEMVMELEEEFGFNSSDSEAEQIRTIGDLIERLDEFFRRKK